MGGRTVISPTARGWRIRRRWRGQLPPDKTPIHALLHRRWLVEATCLGIPSERWVWQVPDRHTSVAVVEEVAAALARGDPSPQPADAELIEHVTAGGPPSPLGHVRPMHSAPPDANRPEGDEPSDGATSQQPPASPTSDVHAPDSAQPADSQVVGPNAVQERGSRRRRRIRPLTVAVVLVLLGRGSVAPRPLVSARRPVPARRVGPTMPVRLAHGRAASCPPPAPLPAGTGKRVGALYNAAGGALWASGFVLLGYAAGTGWRHVEQVAKRASLLLLALAAVGVLMVAARTIHQLRTVRQLGVPPPDTAAAAPDGGGDPTPSTTPPTRVTRSPTTRGRHG
jgi:hypothetical protein